MARVGRMMPVRKGDASRCVRYTYLRFFLKKFPKVRSRHFDEQQQRTVVIGQFALSKATSAGL